MIINPDHHEAIQMPMVYNEIDMNNRSSKRKVRNEIKRYIENLEEIEWEFIGDMLEREWDYDDIYTYYLEEYAKEIERLRSLKVFRYSRPEEEYFMLVYKPQEHSFEVNDTLLNTIRTFYGK